MRMTPWVAAVAVACAAAAPVQAADWPGERPVRLVVPAAAGGSLDTLARPLAQAMSDISGGTFIVENRGGAGGAIGADNVAKSKPDGYSLLMGGVHHMILPVAYPEMPYDTGKDLLPVSLFATVPNVLLVPAKASEKTVQELVERAKAEPGSLNYGTGGKGTLHHLTTERFDSIVGIDTQAVHYRGSAPAIADLMGGQIDFMFETMPSALGQIKAGTLRPLAVTSAERSAALPDVPTLAEAGVPDLAVTTWYGIFGPAGLPDEVTQAMRDLVNKALASDQVQRLWKDYGATTSGEGSGDFPGFASAELQRWAQIGGSVDLGKD
ncbi:tripartite tricarboxylate transporter substrate binding protein [Verticiella sediminum]|uniref:Tripartite tricarboxylate transporter substrate binding protein n=1 Tax=Verticiella sediminum TaxID=1247510 RepID=A0A556B059_9BURK|nr:tripartite tricarboxylate transporter substrate binding protein [Verticiella sediminum]TSH98546.1 tripartite tricarboxylate transporter substrate binding protein [Verticiella sediminum]